MFIEVKTLEGKDLLIPASRIYSVKRHEGDTENKEGCVITMMPLGTNQNETYLRTSRAILLVGNSFEEIKSKLQAR